MAFVKLDTGMLNSSIWADRDARSIFVTALLMAEPVEVTEPMPQYCVRALEETGWFVPPGKYGLVPSAGVGLLRRDGISDQEEGLRRLEELGSPDPESRSSAFEGRRLVRVDGGYLVLNYFQYREKDHTAAARMRKFRDKKKGDGDTVTRNERNATPLYASASVSGSSSSRSRTTKKPVGREGESNGVALATSGTSRLAALTGKREPAAVLARMAQLFGDVMTERRASLTVDQARGVKAEILFLYWSARFGHPKAILDSKRKGKLVARLKENGDDVSELLYALDGASNDAWIMGTAQGADRKYDDIVTILRDRGQVERFAGTRKRYRDGEPHKVLPKLEAAIRGDGEVYDEDAVSTEHANNG